MYLANTYIFENCIFLFLEEDITVRFIAADLLSSKRAIGFVQFVDKAKIPAIKKRTALFSKKYNYRERFCEENKIKPFYISKIQSIFF